MAKNSKSTTSLRLRLICADAPADSAGLTEFGLQDRSGALYAGSRLADGALEFALEAPVAEYNNNVRFLGPFVHGAADTAFLYLSLKRFDLAPPRLGHAPESPATQARLARTCEQGGSVFARRSCLRRW